MENPLPPILQVTGLKLIAMGQDEHGTYLKFGATRKRVREVTVYLLADGPVRWEYIYSIWDATTRTVVTYRGHDGDPTKDRRVDIRGA